MATKHEDVKTELPKDRPMDVQQPRDEEIVIDGSRRPEGRHPSFRDEPMDPRTGLQGKPESPSDNPGQRTRDNVTPVIPSAPPGEGGIVDPRSLGMETDGGVAPLYPPLVKSINEDGTPADQSVPGHPDTKVVNPDDLPPGHFNASVNEPPGSNVGGEGAGEGGELDEAPDLDRLEPDEADAGDAEDIVMHVHGTGFTPESVIYFNGLVEPTTFVSETEVTTGVKPSLFVVPAVCPVTVRNGEHESDALEFEFLDPEDPPAARETKRTTRTTKAKTKPKKAAKKSKSRK